MSASIPAGRITDAGAASAREAVEEGARRYFEERRARIDGFVDAHFSLAGTLRLHRRALGWDVLRAPVNISLAAPQLLLHAAAAAASRLRARRLAHALDRSILLPTSVSRQIEWLIHTEFLELPFAQAGQESGRDALSEAIAAVAAGAAGHGSDAAFRGRLAGAMTSYGATRSAAAEITTGFVTLGTGAVVLNKLTPGAATLGPALAASMAQGSAITAFPLGATLGGFWYGLFPVHPSGASVVLTTVLLMIGLAIFAAFAGIVFDPIQRALGLHRARLRRMVDALERQFFDPRSRGFAVHDHYIARLLDVLDLLGAVARTTRL